MKTFTRFLSALLIALLLVPTASVALAETAEPTELIFYFLGEELEDDPVVIGAINEKLIEKLNCYMTVEYIPFGEVNTPTRCCSPRRRAWTPYSRLTSPAMLLLPTAMLTWS